MGATFTLKGSGSGAVKAVQDLQKALAEVDKSADAATKSNAQLERAAKRVGEQADPQRKYNRQMAELATLVDKGKVSMVDAERVATKYGDRLERAGQSGDRAFGASMQANLASTITQLASAAAIVGTIRQTFGEIAAAREAAAQNVVASVAGFGELAQISPDQETADRLVAFGRRLISQGVVKPGDEGLAASIAFQLDSAQLSESDKEFILQVGRSKFVRPESLAQFGGSIGQLQAAFGIGETGDARALANKAVAAASPTKATAQQIAESVAKLAPGALALGYGDEEAFAAESEVARVYGSASEAETRVRALLAAIDRQGVNAGSFAGTISAVQSRVAGGESLRNILGGSQEAIDAFRILARSDFAQSVAGIDEAQRDDVVGRRAGFIANDPNLRAAIRRQVAEGQLESVNQGYAEQENLLASIRAEQRARLGNGFAATVRDYLAYAPSNVLGTEEARIEAEFRQESQRRAAGDSPQLSDALFNDLRDYMRRTAEATERMERRRPVTTRTE